MKWPYYLVAADEVIFLVLRQPVRWEVVERVYNDLRVERDVNCILVEQNRRTTLGVEMAVAV
ncbi:MAG: hypothetical protein ABL888_04740 [Pirellulaceae bacterium]